jgi:hypothetical protein
MILNHSKFQHSRQITQRYNRTFTLISFTLICCRTYLLCRLVCFHSLRETVVLPCTSNRALFASPFVDYFVSQYSCCTIDGAVRIATAYGLDNQGVGVRVPVVTRISLLDIVQTGSGVHPTSYPVGTRDPFPGGKAAGSWSWPLTSN